MAPRLLLVESEVISRRRISRFLTSGGYSVTEAASGRTALNLLATSKFDLVIADFRLMDGIEGSEVLACAEGLQPGIISLLLGRPSDLTHGKPIDAAFVVKPVQLEELRLKIGLLLIHQTRVPDIPATKVMIAKIRSQRAASMIQGARFQELRVRLEETLSQNLKLREKSRELTKELRHMRSSRSVPV
jgi:DNA-binding response OmpR family regulator